MLRHYRARHGNEELADTRESTPGMLKVSLKIVLKKMHTNRQAPGLVSNLQPYCCEATVLTTTPPHHLMSILYCL